jgi:hypothetical protein
MKVTPTPGSVSGRRIDRVGDPLEGLVNLFDLSLVLAVGLLLAALSSAGVVGIISPSGGGGTPIPGQPSGGNQTQGQGQEVGKVYRLADGSYVFAPAAGGAAKSIAPGASGATSTPTTPQVTPGATGSTGTSSQGGGLGGATTVPSTNPGAPGT